MPLTDKRLEYIVGRCNSYLEAKVDIQMYEQILELINEVKQHRLKDKIACNPIISSDND